MLLFAERWPNFVYKYMSGSRAAQVLCDLKFYMAPLSTLNDLYDMNVTGFWQEEEETKYRIFAKRLLVQGQEDDLESALALARKMPLESIAKGYQEWLDDNMPIFDSFMHNTGVTCFTSQPNNQRMWGTYGVNSTGAVLEFNTDISKWPMSELLRSVIYADQRLPICPSQLIEIEQHTHQPMINFKVLQMLLCTKHMDWRDEMEWRLLMISNDAAASRDRLISFPRSAISHAFIGPRITQEDERAVRAAARRYDPPIPVIKRVPDRKDQREDYEGAEIITDYSQIEYWTKQHEK